jgi:hypothetical protein
MLPTWLLIPMDATCPVHLILDLIILMIFGKAIEYHVISGSGVKGKTVYFLGGGTDECEWSASLHTQITVTHWAKT